MKFRINDGQGKHRHGEYVYKAGEVLEHDGDLAAAFPGRFTRVADSTPVTEVQRIPIVRLTRTETLGSPGVQALRQKMDREQKGSKEPAPASQPGGLGADVTDEFPAAGDNGFRVFKSGRWHYVALATEPETALNDRGITRDEVAGYIGAPAV